MPAADSGLDWKRLLVRSGVRFIDSGSRLDFGPETPGNLAFLKRIFGCGGWGSAFDGVNLTTDSAPVHERKWLGCWDRLHSGAEAGATGFEAIELALMDTYMAGVVRWLNALGVQTFISCDGHARRPPYIEVEASHLERTENLVRAASHEELTYDGWYILVPDPGSPDPRIHRDEGRRRQPPRHRWPDRRELLDLAEHLHAQFYT